MKLIKSDEIAYDFEVISGEQGERLDKFITSKISEQTRSQVQFLILNSGVTLNNIIEKNCGKKLKIGDLISIFIITKQTSIEPYNLKLDIVYEDEDLMVINKPANLTVHPGTNTDNQTLANALVSYCKTLSSASGDDRPGIVHRLDKDTSGLMLIAKNNDTHLYLCGQIMERKVKRIYLAITYGVPNPIIGRIITNLAPCKKNPTKMRVVADETGKIAITNYRVIHVYENRMFSLVECELETGRTHQIRVHMKYKNTPIVGDKKYSLYYNFNPEFVSKELVDKIRSFDRQALHAYKISFTHPKSLKPLEFEIPIDSGMKEILNLLKVDNHK